MKILGIETSCDETAICLIETDEANNTVRILGNALYSQVSVHEKYGGVYPNLAKREHAKNLVPILMECLKEANALKEIDSDVLKNIKTMEIESKLKEILIKEEGLYEQFSELFKFKKLEIDAIAVTNGPGLEPALWVGVSFAKALGLLWNTPIIPTNHMEGHIVVAPLKPSENAGYNIEKIDFPAIALLISGGHTQLVLMKDYLHYEIVGNTLDDAVGEAFDKVARILGLPYPGGPQISKIADMARADSEISKKIPADLEIKLPRPMIHSKDLNFSFSGIKTAVLYLWKKIEAREIPLTESEEKNVKAMIADEFEKSITEVLIKKTKDAVEKFGATTIIIGGGVSANKKIRNDFAKFSEEIGVKFLLPELSASTDNAFMIALAGYLNFKAGKKPETDFVANGNLSIANSF